MTESFSTTTAFDAEWGCQTSRYTHRITLLLALLVSGTILALQFPIFIYSPDGSFHAAKILRVTQGDYFTDPFTGMPTIYPSLFHMFYGLINRVIGFNPIQIVQLIVLVDFLALFAGFYYCAAVLLKNPEEVSLCVLALSLVIYAPTSHYILIAQPSSFSFVFLLLSIGAFYRYVIHFKARYLMLGGVLGSLAVNIWWSNVFSVFAVLAVLTYYLLRYGKPPVLSHVVMFVFVFLIPCMYTAWHLYSIRDILPYYLSGSPKKGLPDILTTWIVTFLTKGNLQFMHHLNFWDPSAASSGTAESLAGGLKRLHAMASAVHYFVLVMPFHLLLMAYAVVNLLRKEWPVHPRFDLFRTLAIGGLLCCFVRA